MPQTKSRIAELLERRPEPTYLGGRGRLGPLGRFLIRERAYIARGRAEGIIAWADVAAVAQAEGIHRSDGRPYSARELSDAWNRLARTGRVKDLATPEDLTQPKVASAVTAGPAPSPRTGERTAPPESQASTDNTQQNQIKKLPRFDTTLDDQPARKRSDDDDFMPYS